jgi:translation initiation factor IF-3
MSARKNEQITTLMVRVIGADGKDQGIVPIRIAIQMAGRFGLDLVETDPDATPPVVRMLDSLSYHYPHGKN